MSGDGRICVKTIKRGECIELGHDKFDDVLNEFLAKLNRDQIISIQLSQLRALRSQHPKVPR